MKLSSASKNLTAAGRGSDSRSRDDRNVARDRGISHQTRDTNTHYSESYGTSTEKPMSMDEDGPQRQCCAYKVKSPWSAPTVKYSDPAVFHATLSNNAAPHIRQFAGTIHLGFSLGPSEKISASILTFLSSSNVSWPLLNRLMELYTLIL
jgi:hypothetical protein